MIPVVDLADFPAEQSKLLLACQQLGCFRVVNHGVPAALQADMKAVVRSLHELPEELKQTRDVMTGSGYLRHPNVPFFRTFRLYNAASPADVDDFCSWLETSPRHREIIKSYASELHELAVNIAGKIAESMGLGSDFSFKDWSCQLQLNKYNFSEGTVGSSARTMHTDPGFLTVLQEDVSVGGLEVMNETGEFVTVDPVPGSLLVNLGDVAKAWSNGRLQNLKHRVQCKEAAERFSVAFFFLAPKDDIVEPPASFIDDKHPRLYRTFAYEDFRKLRFSTTTNPASGEALSLLSCTMTSDCGLA